MAKRVLIVGCGYVGIPLGQALVQEGHQVWGMRRDSTAHAQLQEAGITPLVSDITRSKLLAEIQPEFEWVINLTSSGRGGVDAYEAVYLQGSKNLIDWLRGSCLEKYVYTSSTSVYGQTKGEVVKESSPAEGASPTSSVLVQTENLLLDQAKAGFPAVILRVAGIYGPGRGHLFLQYLRNEARIQGKGDRFINMIHLQDLITVIRGALLRGRPGEIYNAVDDEPVPQIHFLRWLSETLGKWMPPHASDEELAQRKRGLTNKKVTNRKAKMELDCTFKYPTFRQGYTAEIKRLDDAGELNIELEPR